MALDEPLALSFYYQDRRSRIVGPMYHNDDRKTQRTFPFRSTVRGCAPRLYTAFGRFRLDGQSHADLVKGPFHYDPKERRLYSPIVNQEFAKG